jgi:ATP-dependent exoDNAse (exonuclease V) beta subunit
MNIILSTNNHNERDELVKFYERGHKYEIQVDKKSKYTSVTTWVHSHFPKFDADAIIAAIFKSKSWNPENKYWGQTAEEIKAGWKTSGTLAASSGTSLHAKIEKFMNNPVLPPNYTHKELYEFYQLNNELYQDEPVEWQHFITFIKDYPELKPYRTEWMIFNEELKIAGSIDMVYENPDGTLMIYDWKRCKDITKRSDWNKRSINPLIAHIHDTNFWHYSLQLNTYKTILEEKYGKTVTKLCLVRLHPDIEENTYELLEVPMLITEMTELFEARRADI